MSTDLHPLSKMILGKLNSLVDGNTISIHSDLKGLLKDIIATLHDVAEMIDKVVIKSEIVRSWLKQLGDVLYELDDLIDEVYILSSNYSTQQVSSSSSLSRFFINNTFQFKSKLATPLREIHQRLIHITETASRYGYITSSANPDIEHRRRRNETFWFLVPREVIGRGIDVKAVTELILKAVDEADQRVPVVPILGSVAIGKTTLAGLIFNHERISNFYDLRLWLCAGACHDISHFLRRLNSQLFSKNEEDVTQQIQIKMREFLEHKRTLIVLDDVEDNTLHKRIARELTDMLSDKTSVIILTTCSSRAASLIGTTPAYRLQPLSLDDSCQLFRKCAFRYGLTKHVQLEDVAREFVKCCSGVPLLLKTVVALLAHMPTYHQWKRTLEDLRDHGESFADIRKDIQLDDRLKIQSFSNLSLQSFRLQKDCGLSVEALTCVWMALGFLYNSDDTTQPPEHIARKTLKEFVDCALCPDVQYAPGGVVQHISFNDALYQLATQSENPCWAIVRDKTKFDGFPIHIIWDQDCQRGTTLTSDHIRSPNVVRLFMVKPGRQATVHFVRDIVSCFGCLRVLGLGGCDVELLPDSIGQLKHLRYLDVGRNPRIRSLPDSISNLWFLQTLFLHGCSQLEELPANIGRLQNLRYLTLTILKQTLPEAVGELTSLRTLGLTSCPRLASLPIIIKNLKNLETLAVLNCPELDLAATSSVAAFSGLDSIQTLLLSHLPKFASLPSDLGNPSVALKHLQILSCTSMAETKWITQFRFLGSLTIEECPKLTDFMLTDGASQLNGLLELVVRRCSSLSYTAWIRQFTSLRSLIINVCPKLVELDAGFSELKNLERMEIKGCPLLTNWFASPAGKQWRRIAHVRMIEVDGAPLGS